jgi:hypothetical protein
MRFIELDSTYITKFVSKILYQESFRVFNEHAMRLLLDQAPDYERAGIILKAESANESEKKRLA